MLKREASARGVKPDRLTISGRVGEGRIAEGTETIREGITMGGDTPMGGETTIGGEIMIAEGMTAEGERTRGMMQTLDEIEIGGSTKTACLEQSSHTCDVLRLSKLHA